MCSSLLGPVASTFSARALASFNEENPSSRSLLLKRACTGILILATSHTVRIGGAAVVGGGGGGGGGVLSLVAYTWRLHQKGVPFSGLRYMKG